MSSGFVNLGMTQIKYWFSLGMIAATALKIGQYERYEEIRTEYLTATRSEAFHRDTQRWLADRPNARTTQAE